MICKTKRWPKIKQVIRIFIKRLSMNKAELDGLREKYSAVFEKDLKTIRACGREACQELIIALSCTFPEYDFGDAETGWIKTETVTPCGKALFLGFKGKIC